MYVKTVFTWRLVVMTLFLQKEGKKSKKKKKVQQKLVSAASFGTRGLIGKLAATASRYCFMLSILKEV